MDIIPIVSQASSSQPSPELSRTAVLLGEGAIHRLARSRVVVIGLGAVGGYAAEALARSGVGWLRVVDFDIIQRSNVNRQLLALSSTINRAKVDVASERLLDINPGLTVEAIREFAHAQTMDRLLADRPDLVIDAVDSLGPKVEVIAAGERLGIAVYSALGAATRVDADRVKFGRLFSAKGCPLGRLVRKRLRKRGVTGEDLWCVYSDEPKNPGAVIERDAAAIGEEEYRRGRERSVLGSMATVTGLFGLRLGHEAVLRLAGFGDGIKQQAFRQ